MIWMSTANADDGKGKLNTWDAVSIIVGIVIGTTIFRVPQLIFANTTSPSLGLTVWVIGGLVALVGAYCYAEMGATHPKAGGDYFYISRGFCPSLGFLFGWAQMAIVMPASIGVMAVVFGEFLLTAAPGKIHEYGIVTPTNDGRMAVQITIGENTYPFDPVFAFAVCAVLALTLTNILGVVVGKTLQNLLTAAKVIGLLGIVVAGIAYAADDAWVWHEPRPPAAPMGGRTVIWQEPPFIGALALILVLYAYGGWNDSAFVAAEVRNPKRNVPRALFIGIAIIIVVYVLVNAAFINGLSWNEVSKPGGQPLPLRLIAKTPLGDRGAQVMSILILISALGAANGLILTGPRVYAAMGAEHGLFGWMGRWRPGRGAPIVALLFQAVVTVGFLVALTTEHGHQFIIECVHRINDVGREINAPPIHIDKDWKPGEGFEKLVDRTAPVFWLFFMLAGMSLFSLREKFKHIERPYSVPLYPLTPLLFIAACAWMLYRSIIYIEWHALFAFGILLLGVPLYWLSKVLFGLPDELVSEGPSAASSMQQAETQVKKGWK
jgi:basic amino acid/polyamine antiporter, APA family